MNLCNSEFFLLIINSEFLIKHKHLVEKKALKHFGLGWVVAKRP